MTLRHTPILRPTYSDRFQCIGSACEDTCCARWSIQFDKAVCDKFEALPESTLRNKILTQIQPAPPTASFNPTVPHFQFQPTQDGACPFHSADKLCEIQTALGEDYLPRICALYPRLPMCIDQLEEKPLTLSCPEAARLILLDKNLLAPSPNGHYQFNWDDAKTLGEPITAWFWPIRDFSLRLIANRNYPLWQRIFLLALFTRRLDALAASNLDALAASNLACVARGKINGNGKPLSFGKVFIEYESAIRFGSLRGSMEKIQPNLTLQLDMVLRLVGMRAKQAFANPRTTQMLKIFLDGVGYTPESKLADLTVHYADAYKNYYAPLMEKEPHILENFFTNQIFRAVFPFGREGLPYAETNENSIVTKFEKAKNSSSKIKENIVQLITYYTLIKGLLIGIAGFHRENFSAAHALATIQIASRHFEHQPAFIDQACLMLTQHGHDTPQGIAMLVRN